MKVVIHVNKLSGKELRRPCKKVRAEMNNDNLIRTKMVGVEGLEPPASTL